MFGYSCLSSKPFSFFFTLLIRKSVYSYQRLGRKHLCQAADNLANLVGDVDHDISPVHSLNPNIKRIKNHQLQQLLITPSKIISDPVAAEKKTKIVTLGLRKFEERRRSLIEFGFTNVTSSEILRYSSLMKSTAPTLQKKHKLPKGVNPLETLVSHLNVPSDFLETVRFKYPTIDIVSLSSIKKIVFQEYVSWFFKISSCEAFLFMETCPSILNRSLCSIIQVWDIFLHDIGYSLKKIQNDKEILKIDPLNLKRILNEITEIAGLNTRELIKRHHRFAFGDCDSIKKINEILCENGISAKQILKCPGIYNLEASTVQSRFVAFENREEFNLLKSHSRFLFLLHFFTRSIERLEYLKSVGYTQISIHLLTTSNNKFQKWCSNVQVRITPKDCIQLLANMFGKSHQEVSLQLKQHPKSSSLNLDNIKTIKLIEEYGFSQNQIYSALPIILYDPLFIEAQLKSLPFLKEIQPYCDWITRTNALHLVIYLIEHSYGFTWEGVPSAKIKKVRQEIIFKTFSSSNLSESKITDSSKKHKVST